MREEAHVARAEPALHEVLAQLRAVPQRVQKDLVDAVCEGAVIACNQGKALLQIGYRRLHEGQRVVNVL